MSIKQLKLSRLETQNKNTRRTALSLRQGVEFVIDGESTSSGFSDLDMSKTWSMTFVQWGLSG